MKNTTSKLTLRVSFGSQTRLDSPLGLKREQRDIERRTLAALDAAALETDSALDRPAIAQVDLLIADSVFEPTSEVESGLEKGASTA